MTAIDMYKTAHALAKQYHMSTGRLTRHLEALKDAQNVTIRAIQIGNQMRYHVDDIHRLLDATETLSVN